MIKTLVYMAVMALLLSCSKGGVEPFSPDGESGVPVAFSPSTDWQPVSGAKSSGTKSLIENDEDLKGYSISLLGNAVRGGETYPVFKNHQLEWSNSEGWHYSPLKYWIPEANYTFAAFCPYATDESIAGKISNGTVSVSGTDTNPVITITDYNTTVEITEDLLFAKEVRDNTSSENYSAVQLDFQHLLSCISFNIRNTTSTAITSIKNISFLGFKYECDIVINVDKAVLITDDTKKDGIIGTDITSSNANPYLPAGMSSSSYKPLFDDTFITVLPQQVYGNGIVLQFVAFFGSSDHVGTEYSLNLSSIDAVTSWVAGHKYVYNISISSKDIIFQVAEVPWREDNIIL